MKQIPNLFTLLNLLFGCLAIIAVLQNGIIIQYNDSGAQFIDIPEKIWMASLFIGLAAVVDFLDGFIARLFKSSSEMGKQLDSLADVVSFGVAPSMIVFQFLRLSFAKDEDSLHTTVLWLVPALFIAAAAAYRLAKFNLDDSRQFGFRGVPTPAVGLLVASFPLIYWNTEQQFIIDLLLNKWLWYAVIAILCWLMVSNIPLMAMKFKNTSVKSNFPKILLLLVSIITTLFLQWLAVPVIFIAYILLSLIFKNR